METMVYVYSSRLFSHGSCAVLPGAAERVFLNDAPRRRMLWRWAFAGRTIARSHRAKKKRGQSWSNRGGEEKARSKHRGDAGAQGWWENQRKKNRGGPMKVH